MILSKYLIPLFKNSLKKSKISSGNMCNYCIKNVQTFGFGCINKNSLAQVIFVSKLGVFTSFINIGCTCISIKKRLINCLSLYLYHSFFNEILMIGVFLSKVQIFINKE